MSHVIVINEKWKLKALTKLYLRSKWTKRLIYMTWPNSMWHDSLIRVTLPEQLLEVEGCNSNLCHRQRRVMSQLSMSHVTDSKEKWKLKALTAVDLQWRRIKRLIYMTWPNPTWHDSYVWHDSYSWHDWILCDMSHTCDVCRATVDGTGL